MTDAALDHAAVPTERPLVQELTHGLGTREMAIAVYALYMAALVTGGLSAVGGAIIAHFACRKAPSLLRSHYAFQLRTFWTGLAIAVAGALVLTVSSFGLLLLAAAGLYVMVRGVAGLGRVMNNRPARAPRGVIR